MPRRKKGSDYYLLQMKLARENLLSHVSTQRERSRVVQDYALASRRNGLENERQNLKHYAEKLPTGLQSFYFTRIGQLTDDIGKLKKAYPKFRSNADTIY